MTKLGDGKVKRSYQRSGMRKPVVVELDGATGLIKFREKGCRMTYSIPILTVFYHAVRLNLTEK